jgi:DNA end-binding protein Ku
VRFRRVCTSCGDDVALEDLARGVEYAEARFVSIDAEELPAASSGKSLAIASVTGADEMDQARYDKAYLAGPVGGAAAGAYRLLAGALVRQRAVGIGTLALKYRDRLAAVGSDGELLVVHTLHWQRRRPVFPELATGQPPEEDLAAAGALLEARRGRAWPVDEYGRRLAEVVAARLEAARSPQAQPAVAMGERGACAGERAGLSA